MSGDFLDHNPDFAPKQPDYKAMAGKLQELVVLLACAFNYVRHERTSNKGLEAEWDSLHDKAIAALKEYAAIAKAEPTKGEL